MDENDLLKDNTSSRTDQIEEGFGVEEDASGVMYDQVGSFGSTDPLIAKEDAAYQTATLEHEGLLPVASIAFVNERFDDMDGDKSGDINKDELTSYKDLDNHAQSALVDNVAEKYDDIRYAKSGQRENGITHEDLDLKLGETTREAQKFATTYAAGGLLLNNEELFKSLDNRGDQNASPDGQIGVNDLKAFTEDKDAMERLSEEERKALETLRDEWDNPAGRARRGISGEQDSMAGDGITRESLISGLDGVPDDFAATERGAMSLISNQKLFDTLDNFAKPDSQRDGQVGISDLKSYLDDKEASGKLEQAHRNSLNSLRDRWDDVSGQVWRAQMTDNGLKVGDTITQESLQTRMAYAYGGGMMGDASDTGADSSAADESSEFDYFRQEDGPQPNW